MSQEREKNLQFASTLRKELAGLRPASLQDVEIVMKNTVRPFYQRTLKVIKEWKDKRERLVQFRDIIKAEKGILPSRPTICSSYVMDVLGYGVLVRHALEGYGSGDSKKFVIFHDMGTGVSLAMSTVFAAERAIEGTLDQFLAQNLTLSGRPVSSLAPRGCGGRFGFSEGSDRDFGSD